jgi:hypothetical protein
VKQTVRNTVVFSTFGLACIAASGGCSDEPAGNFNGFGNTGNATAGAATTMGGSSSGSPSTTAGTPSTTGGTPAGVAGGFGISGTPSTAGASTAGAGGGGAGSGGAGGGGAGTGGAAAGAGGTGQIGDFPPGCPAPAGVHTGTEFTRSCFSITASSCAATTGNMNPPGNAIDGMTNTRWSTGAIMASSKQFTFTVDLGSEVMVSGVSTSATAKDPPDGTYDTPPQIEVSTSTDGTTFTPVACGDSGVEGIDVGFAAKSAKFVRLVQHGVKTANWWTITELHVYGSGTTCATGTSSHMCTVSVTQ